MWLELKEYSGEEVFVSLDPDDPAPEWWLIALELLMIADEASRDLGFDPQNPFFEPIALGLAEYDVLSGDEFRQVQRAPHTFSTAARSVLCVQPKSLTPGVGCTLRSLSHHLSLLPGQGQVRARWVLSPFSSESTAPVEDLGLLLVPFPYRVVDGAFQNGGVHNSGRWGWFDVEQSWLPGSLDRTRRRELVAFIRDLVDEARSKGDRVDAVILPELALDYALFNRLARALAEYDIDFLISGISTNRDGRPGNFVAIAPFFLLGSEWSDVAGLQELFLVREKHHRWKLNGSQIKDYAIESDLDPNKSWWERLDLLGRSLDVLVYRGGTSLTTLICEDLARVDPCQSVLRAIGPNLVIALLMDGAQLKTRWPARYATVLAEDPGSSVLSFTSLGLISRQNDHGHFGQQTSVGLWKDEIKGVEQLELPREADALYLKLSTQIKTEHSLDGRSDNGSSHRWVFDRVHGIAHREPVPPWIVTGKGR
ncbi:hypothetical protein [Bradyrhizobium sp. USDA 241]|uniref:hypothetical protein n=1 Tax=Bradyrhizobium sp. USDA 241 TaxID=3377725 RepID=UPI003C7177C8